MIDDEGEADMVQLPPAVAGMRASRAGGGSVALGNMVMKGTSRTSESAYRE